MSVPPAVMRRVMRELNELEKNPPEGIRMQMNDEDMLDVTGIIAGPEGTPYAGGYFRVKFKFTEEFPAAPPKCWFATKIFHPNVGPTGEICVNTLKKDWKSSYGIGHILVTVKCLLIYPNPESALDEEAGKLLLEDYQSYCDRAKLITSVHATPRVKPVEFNRPSASESDSGPPASTKDSNKGLNKESSTDKDTAPSNKETQTKNGTPANSEIPQKLASTSKLAAPTVVVAPAVVPLTASISPAAIVSPYMMPVLTRKSSSPAPPMSLKASLSSEKTDKDGQKERYPSPSPLGTADANVGGGNGKPGTGVGLGMASTAAIGGVLGTKAVKRAATGTAVSGAEKRKKALKRL